MGTTNKVYEQLKQLEITASNKNFTADFSDTGKFEHSSARKYSKLKTDDEKIKFLDRQIELNDTFLQHPLTYGGESQINLEERHDLLLEKSRILSNPSTQSDMAEDLSAHIANEQSNKVAYTELTPIGADFLSVGNDLNSEVIEIPTPVIAASDVVQVEAVDSQSFASTFPTYDENSDGLFVRGTEPQTTLTDTYKPGDASLARQLESKTYGVDNDRNLVPPGYETKLIDEFGDTHGKSEQNVASAAAAVAAEQVETQAAIAAKEKTAYENQINTDFGTPDGFFAGSSDKSGFNKNSVYAAGKTDEVKKAAAFEKAQIEAKSNAEKLMAEMANDTLKAEQLILDEKETIGNTRFGKANSGTISDIDAKIFKEARQQRAYEASLKKLAESGADGLGKPNELVELTKESNDAQNKFTDNNQYVNHHGPAIQQEIAEFEREDTLLDRHPATGKTKLEIAAEKDARNKDPEFIRERAKAKTLELQAKQAAEKAALEQTAKDDKDFRDESSTPDGAEANAVKEKSFKKLQAQSEADKKAKQAAELNKAAEEKRIAEEDARRQIIAGDPYAFSNLSYPLNVTNNNENGHYILFYVNVQNKTKYLYDTPDIGVTVGDSIEIPGAFIGGDGGPAGGGAEYKATHQGKGAAAGEIAYQAQTVKNGGKGNILRNNMKFLQKSRKAPYSGINSRYPTTTRITDSVALYLPPAIGNTTSATYGDSETGVAGFLALSGVDIIQDVKDLDFAGATDKLFGVGGRLITEAIKKIGIKSLEALTETEGLIPSFDKIFGQTLNPYIEVTYTSFGMRTFDYTFQFAPTSRKETDEVKAIIQLFRFHMAPEMKGDAHRYLTLPSTFDIHYMFQSGMDDAAMARENSFYNKIATCVLTNVAVDYTPEGVKSFKDGAPTQLTMALSFKETEMLTKQKINDGF